MSGFLLIGLTTLVIGLVFNRQPADEQARAKPIARRKRPEFTARRTAQFIVVAVIIGVCEIVSPSSWLTGRTDMPSRDAPRILENQIADGAPRSVGQLSRTDPRFKLIGYIGADDMRSALLKDIQRLKDEDDSWPRSDTHDPVSSETPEPDLSEMSFMEKFSALTHWYRLELLTHALTDIDDVFADDRMPGLIVRAKLLERMNARVDQIGERVGDESRTFWNQMTTFEKEWKGGKIPPDLPAYKTLTQGYANADAKLSVLRIMKFSVNDAIEHIATYQSLRSPDTLLPPVSAIFPFETLDQVNFRPALYYDVVEGPKIEMTTAHMLHRAQDVLANRTRSSKEHKQTRVCGYGFETRSGQPDLVPLCELSLVIPVNYDVTGKGCEDPVLRDKNRDDLDVSEALVGLNACRENWTFPHLNIVLRTDSVTFYPPLPVELADQPRAASALTRWTVIWAGQRVPIVRPTTLPWDGTDLAFKQLMLIHEPLPTVEFPRVWSDFRTALAGETPPDLIEGASFETAHRFLERSVSLDQAQIKVRSAKKSFAALGKPPADGPQRALMFDMPAASADVRAELFERSREPRGQPGPNPDLYCSNFPGSTGYYTGYKAPSIGRAWKRYAPDATRQSCMKLKLAVLVLEEEGSLLADLKR